MKHNKNYFKNNKGQVAETLTWIVATIVIVLILVVSAFVASVLSKTKIVQKENSATSTIDLFAEKSLTSYLLTKDNSGTIIYRKITQDGNLNDFNGQLAVNLFGGLYSGYYNYAIFLGVLDITKDNNCALYNPYFGSSSNPAIKAGTQARCKSASTNPLSVYYLVRLDNNRFVQLVLWRTNS